MAASTRALIPLADALAGFRDRFQDQVVLERLLGMAPDPAFAVNGRRARVRLELAVRDPEGRLQRRAVTLRLRLP